VKAIPDLLKGAISRPEAEEDQFSTKQCSYYMWRQQFPVENECRVEQRKDVGKWAITLDFSMGE